MEKDNKRFPILGITQRDIDNHPDRPRNVPWSMLAPHEERAKRNHDQTLQRLAERGGLSPTEMIAVIEDRPLRWITQQPRDESACWDQLIEYIRQHEGIAATELEFLRWFYHNVSFGTGCQPAEEAVMERMKKSFEEQTRKTLPRGYEIKK